MKSTRPQEDLQPAEVLLEFCEVWMHTVLHARGVYPEQAFQPLHVYGTEAVFCRHPGVVEYVANSLAELLPLIEAGTLRAVHLEVWSGANNQPLETLTLEWFWASSTSSGLLSDAATLQTQFGQMLLHVRRALRSEGVPLSPDVSFTLRVDLINRAWEGLNTQWKSLDIEQCASGHLPPPETNPSVHPILSIRVGPRLRLVTSRSTIRN